jgi:hypothetical protein
MSKFNAIAPKAAALVRMLHPSTKEGEWLNAVRALLHLLASAGLDIHALAARIENDADDASRESLNAAEMQRIYDAAYQKGFAHGSEHGRKNAIIAGPSIGTFNIGVDSGVNGYSWQQIARHCAANKHLFYGRDLEFVESIARQLEWKSRPSPPQAPWLKDLFMRRFGGRID